MILWMLEWIRFGVAIVCRDHTWVFLLSGKNEKVLVPLREQGQKRHFCGTTLFAGNPTASLRRQHAACPLTLAMRQKILWSPISLCPRRPICCPAFRSALSYAELSVDAPCSFTSASLVSIYVMPFIHHLCTFVKHFFSRPADKFGFTPTGWCSRCSRRTLSEPRPEWPCGWRGLCRRPPRR